MFRSLLLLLTIVLVSAHAVAATASASASESLAPILNFEAEQTGGFPTGWRGVDRPTIHIDASVVHSGKAAARIERTPASEGKFSALTNSVRADFLGNRVELRGWVRTDSVTGMAGLWMREDGRSGMLEFDNMADRRLRGSNDWKEYTISLPLNPATRELFFGFLVAGDGTAWVDDLQLLVDGKPIWQAPRIEWSETAMDRDHEFDAGSKITLDSLSPGQIENLATLARVWGFLKYHHPKATSGDVQWDYELFRVMPAVLATGDQAAAEAVLTGWIDRLGPLELRGRPALAASDTALPPDLNWIADEGRLGAPLAAKLRAVHAAGFSGQFYVSLVEGVGNPSFSNELDYPRLQFPDSGYRLLSVFRYWNIIRYWFPYRDLIDGNWDEVLAEFIPRVGLAANEDVYRLEMMALIAKVSDTHANLWDSLRVRPPIGDSELPVVLRFIEDEAIVSDVLPTAVSPKPQPLQRGDVIVAIDGEPVSTLVRQWSPYYAASNKPTRMRDIAGSMTRGSSGSVRLQIRRDGALLELEATRVPSASLSPRSPWHDLPGPTFRLLSPDAAYLKLSGLKRVDVPGYVKQAAGTKGLIIDARNYPTDFLVFALGSQFIDHGVDFARVSRASLENPGAFFFLQPFALSPIPPGAELPGLPVEPSNVVVPTSLVAPTDFPEWTPQSRARYPGKVIVLVDEVTQSAAEYTAMALRAAPRTIILGSTTAGADGNISAIPLPGGLHTMMSGIGIFYPDKRPTQRVGIVPDIEVKPTRDGIRAGRDEVLEAALREILGPGAAVEELIRRAQGNEN